MIKEKRTKVLQQYFITILNDLDGYGIVLVDEEIVRNRMKEYGNFLDLQEIFKEYPIEGRK